MSSITNTIFEASKRDHKPVVIFVSNGYQLHGIVQEYDEVAVFIKDGHGKSHVVHRGHIITVDPA